MSEELKVLLFDYLEKVMNAEDTSINKQIFDCALYLVTTEIEVVNEHSN